MRSSVSSDSTGCWFSLFYDVAGEAGQEVDVFRQDGGDGHVADGMGDERRDVAEKEKDEAACAQPLGRDFRVCEVEKNRRAAHASRG